MDLLKKIKTYYWTIVGIVLLYPTVIYSAQTEGIINPLGGINSLDELLLAIVEAARGLGFLVAVLALVYAGFMFVTAQGNKEKLETAKKSFWWVIIGTGVLLGAQVLAEVLQATVQQF